MMWRRKKQDVQEEKSIQELIFNLQYGNEREAIVKTLGEIGDDLAVEPLIKVLMTYPEVSQALVQICRRIQTVEPLIQKLNVPDGLFLEHAVEILGKVGDVQAVEPLTRLFEQDKRQHIREKIIGALGQIGIPAIAPVIKALEDNSWKVRGAAVEVLGEIRHAQGIPPLVNALRDTHSDVRRRAVEALEKIGAPAVEALRKVPATDHWYAGSAQIPNLLKNIYAMIHIVTFGNNLSHLSNIQTTWLNPDVSTLDMSLLHLERIEIDTDRYNFHLIERFITYAVNYIGQKHLKKHVAIHLYGDPEKLHPNLRNTLTNLCKHVHVHEEAEMRVPISP